MIARLLFVLGLVAAIWVIYNIWTVHKEKTPEQKLLWTIAAIFLSIVTAIVYIITQNEKKEKK